MLGTAQTVPSWGVRWQEDVGPWGMEESGLMGHMGSLSAVKGAEREEGKTAERLGALPKGGLGQRTYGQAAAQRKTNARKQTCVYKTVYRVAGEN